MGNLDIDTFRKVLEFMPYDEWLKLQLVCVDWCEIISDIGYVTEVVNFCNLTSENLTKQNYGDATWFLPPLLSIFKNMTHLIMSGELFQLAFITKDQSPLDFTQIENTLNTITAVNCDIDRAEIRTLPKSVRELRFVGVTVFKKPYYKSALRYVERITFDRFIGDIEMIREYTPRSIDLSFYHHFGHEWPSDPQRIIEYAEHMQNEYALQIRSTALEGYVAPTFALYCCLQDVYDGYQLLDYCFVQKRFPIPISYICHTVEEGFSMPARYLLDISVERGEIEFLQKRGNDAVVYRILDKNHTLLSVAYSTDFEFFLELINKYKFNPNITGEGCIPLLFRVPLDLNRFNRLLNEIEDPDLQIDLSIEYKNESFGAYCIEHNKENILSVLKRRNVVIPDAFNIKQPHENTDFLRLMIDYCQLPPDEALLNHPGYLSRLIRNCIISSICASPGNKHQSCDYLFEYTGFKQLMRSYVLHYPPETFFDEVLFFTLFSTYGGVRNTYLLQLSSLEMNIIDRFEEYNKSGDDSDKEFFRNFFGYRQEYGTYLAHKIAGTNNGKIPFFLTAIDALPHPCQQDNNGNTILHWAASVSWENYYHICSEFPEGKKMVSIKNHQGNIPAHLIGKSLFDGRASLNIDPPLISYDILKEKNHDGYSVLAKWITKNQFVTSETILRLLQRYGESLLEDIQPEHQPSIFIKTLLIWSGRLYPYFLKYADFSRMNAERETLLQACIKQPTFFKEKLLEIGQKCKEAGLSMNHQDKYGNTALHTLAVTDSSRSEVLFYLLEQGADPYNILNNDGHSAFDLAPTKMKRDILSNTGWPAERITAIAEQFVKDMINGIYPGASDIEQIRLWTKGHLDFPLATVCCSDFTYSKHIRDYLSKHNDMKCQGEELELNVTQWLLRFGNHLTTIQTLYSRKKLKEALTAQEKYPMVLHRFVDLYLNEANLIEQEKRKKLENEKKQLSQENNSESDGKSKENGNDKIPLQNSKQSQEIENKSHSSCSSKLTAAISDTEFNDTIRLLKILKIGSVMIPSVDDNQQTVLHKIFARGSLETMENALKLIPKHSSEPQDASSRKNTPLNLLEQRTDLSSSVALDNIKGLYRKAFHLSNKRKRNRNNDENNVDAEQPSSKRRRREGSSSSSRNNHSNLDELTSHIHCKRDLSTLTVSQLKEYLRHYTIRINSKDKKSNLITKVWNHLSKVKDK